MESLFAFGIHQQLKFLTLNFISMINPLNTQRLRLNPQQNPFIKLVILKPLEEFTNTVIFNLDVDQMVGMVH